MIDYDELSIISLQISHAAPEKFRRNLLPLHSNTHHIDNHSSQQCIVDTNVESCDLIVLAILCLFFRIPANLWLFFK